MADKTSSPKGGKRGCLCKDNTYSVDCCQGELIEQGIGSTLSQGVSNVTNTNEARVLVRSNG